LGLLLPPLNPRPESPTRSAHRKMVTPPSHHPPHQRPHPSTARANRFISKIDQRVSDSSKYVSLSSLMPPPLSLTHPTSSSLPFSLRRLGWALSAVDFGQGVLPLLWPPAGLSRGMEAAAADGDEHAQVRHPPSFPLLCYRRCGFLTCVCSSSYLL
jgi:hypothetical protein